MGADSTGQLIARLQGGRPHIYAQPETRVASCLPLPSTSE